MTTEFAAVEEVFGALADPTRRLLLDRLSAHGQATATILAAELPVTRQAITQHLSALTRAGLVTGQRDGRERRYAGCPAKLAETARWMDRTAAQWDQRLAAIKHIAEGQAGDGSS